MPTRAEQRDRTREQLVRSARELFADRGYAAVGLPEVVAAAGVTKGALYHHFPGKAALFSAVLAGVQDEVAEAVVAAAEEHADPWDRLTAGCAAFLAATAAPAVQRVLLVDGPAVLGWAGWRALDEQASGRHLAEALSALVEAGVLPRQPVPPLAALLSGAMNEAALWIAGSAEPDALGSAQTALARLLAGLRGR
ncbi:TetR/AcrR family transcriptional regulator [Geodermatophilus sp. SYSU D01119]